MSNFSLDINSSLERSYRTVPILKPLVWTGIKELLDDSRNSFNRKQRDITYLSASKRTNSGKGIINDLGISTLERSIHYLLSKLENYDSRQRFLTEAFNFKKIQGNYREEKDLYNEIDDGIQMGSGFGDLPRYLQMNYSNFLSYLIDESTTSIFQIYYSEVFDLFSTEWNEKKCRMIENPKQDIVIDKKQENFGSLNSDLNFLSTRKSKFETLLDYKSTRYKNNKTDINESINEHYFILSDLIPNISGFDLNSEKYISIQKMFLSSFNSRIQLVQEISSLSAPSEYNDEIISLWRILTFIVGSTLKTNYTTKQMIFNSIRALELSALDTVLYLNSNIVSNRYGSNMGNSILISLKNFINIAKKLYLSENEQIIVNNQFNFPSEQVHFWFLAYWAFRIGSGQILWDMATKFVHIPQNFSLICKCLAAILLSTSSSLLISQTNEDNLLGEENWIKQCVQFDFNKDLYSSREYRELNSMFYSKPTQEIDNYEQAYYQIIFSIINTSSQSLNIMKLLPNITIEDYIWYQFHIILKTNDDNESSKELNLIFNRIKSQTDLSIFRDNTFSQNDDSTPLLYSNKRNEYYSSNARTFNKSRNLALTDKSYNKFDVETSQNENLIKDCTDLTTAKLFCYTLHFGEAMKWIYINHPQLRNALLHWVLYLSISGLIPIWKETENKYVECVPSFSNLIENDENIISLYETLLKSIRNFNIPFNFIAKLTRLFPSEMRNQILQDYVEFSLIHDIVEDEYTDSATFHMHIESGKSFIKFDTFENIKTSEYSDICDEINNIIAKLAKNRGHYITSILFFMEANLIEDVLDTILDCLKLPLCYSFTALNTRQQLFFDKLQTIINKVTSDSSYQQHGLNIQSKIDSIKNLNEIIYSFVLIQKGFYRSAKEYIESKNFIPKTSSGINSSNISYLPKIIEGYVVSLFELCRSNDIVGNCIPDDVHNAIFCNYHVITSLVSSLASLHSIQMGSAEKIHKLLKEMLILVSPDQLALAKHP